MRAFASRRTLITAESPWTLPDFTELWRSRELLCLLIVSEFKARHRQTVIGASWALVQPIVAMVVFSLLFGHFGKFPSDGLPYPIFFFSGFLVWQLFQKCVGSAVPSLAINSGIIGKIYFPRLHLLIAPLGTNLLDFAMSALVLLALYLYFGVTPSWPIVFFPFFIVTALIAAFAVATWLAPLNIFYRDIQVALPSLLQFAFFVTPVVYPVSFAPRSMWWVLYLNPMTTVIEGCRWCLIGASAPSAIGIVISLAVTVAVSLPGMMYFTHTARTMLDRI
jgi:homopolymeric O-antigen transport system permease protein